MQGAFKLITAAVCAFAAAACSSGDGGNGGNGGTGGTGGDGGASGTGGAQTSRVDGIVYSRGETDTPVAGATVSVIGTQLSTTSDAQGEFTLDGVPNGDNFFLTEASGNWSTIDYWAVPDETRFGADLGVIPDSDVNAVAGALGRTISTSDAIVNVTFYEGAVGGETASIGVPSDPPFTFNALDEPVVSDEVIADGEGFGDLIYTSVSPDDGPISVTVTGAPGATACFVDESPGTTYPLAAKALTIVYAYCVPAQ